MLLIDRSALLKYTAVPSSITTGSLIPCFSRRVIGYRYRIQYLPVFPVGGQEENVVQLYNRTVVAQDAKRSKSTLRWDRTTREEGRWCGDDEK